MSQDVVGEKIRKIRKENKDTLKSLAKKINYDWSSLSKIERGEREVTFDLLSKIIDLYGVNPKYFFSEGFTDAEGRLLIEEDLSPSSLKEKYNFEIDGVEATDEEIKEAVRLIRYLRKDED